MGTRALLHRKWPGPSFVELDLECCPAASLEVVSPGGPQSTEQQRPLGAAARVALARVTACCLPEYTSEVLVCPCEIPPPGCRFPLAALPQDCLALVLSRCALEDMARLACVNRAWRVAAATGRAIFLDRLGAMLLRHFGRHFSALRQASSAGQAAEAAFGGVYSEDRGWLLTVDPFSGDMSLHASVAKVLDLWWADGHGPVIREHQIRRGVPGSDFPSCACVVNAQFFEVFGDVRPPFSLPPGTYSLGWKVAKAHRFVWSLRPSSSSFYFLTPPPEPAQAGAFSGPLQDTCAIGRLRVSAPPDAEVQQLVGGSGGCMQGRCRDPGSPSTQRIAQTMPCSDLREVKLDFRFPGQAVVFRKGQHGPGGGDRTGASAVRSARLRPGHEVIPAGNLQDAMSVEAIVLQATAGPPAIQSLSGPAFWEMYGIGDVALPDSGHGQAGLAAHVSLQVSWFQRSLSGLFVDSFVMTRMVDKN